MRCVVSRTFGKLSAVLRILSELVRLFHGVLLCEGHRGQEAVYNERLGDTLSMLMNVCSALQHRGNLVEWNGLRPIEQRSLPIAMLVSDEPEVLCAVPADIEDLAPAGANLNSRKFRWQRLRSEWNDELRDQAVFVELAEMLFLAVVGEHALDFIVPNYPVGDAAYVLNCSR
jgi:hypothetical protein